MISINIDTVNTSTQNNDFKSPIRSPYLLYTQTPFSHSIHTNSPPFHLQSLELTSHLTCNVMMSTKVISSEASRWLSEIGEEIVVTRGWLRLRTSEVSSSSSDSNATIDIPQALETAETLRFLGFTSTATEAIFNRFEQACTDFPESTILDFAKGRVRSSTDASTTEDDWASAIDRMGINTALRDQIIDQRFEDLRLTKSARFWVLDTVVAKYRFLEGLDMMVLGRKRNPDTGYTSLQSTLGKSKHDKETKSVLTRPGKSGDDSASPLMVTTATDHQTQDFEIELLKGADAPRLRRAIRLDTDPADSTTNRLETVLAAIPGDFSGTQSVLYFSKQRETVYYYVNYARARLLEQGQDVVHVGILHLILPKDLLTDCVEVFADYWKEFVMCCRLQNPVPEHLRYVAHSSVIFGPLLNANDGQVAKCVGPSRDYTALDLLRLPSGAAAMQHCLKGDRFIETLNQRSRLWLEITRSLTSRDRKGRRAPGNGAAGWVWELLILCPIASKSIELTMFNNQYYPQ